MQNVDSSPRHRVIFSLTSPISLISPSTFPNVKMTNPNLPISKRPWLSASLLLATYANFGWILAKADATWWQWVLSAVLTLLIAEALASPWSLLRNVLYRWLKSDMRAFISAMVGAFFAVILLTWLHISAHAILLVAAGGLVRLDAQRAQLRNWQSFAILTVVSGVGLALGGFGYYQLAAL
ncbi:MAG: hypothetical protein SWY16_16550 [Cyanobacteriota bacterium]|nr:hypothetical protein [Cyanobacteriota bacterium]